MSAAVHQLKNGKAAGVDNIQPELSKSADSVIPHLTTVCNMVWQHEANPVDWKNAIIIPLPRKVDLTDGNNWPGITLLLVPGKVFSRVLLNCMKSAVDQLLRQEQAGFSPGRSCMDQIFSLRQIIEKVTEEQKPIILVNFVDFRKSFDCIHRPALWKILELYGVPKKISTIIQKLYQESNSAVKVDGDMSSWFQVITGVRQGCILSPLLFAITIDWLLRRSTERSAGGITRGQEMYTCAIWISQMISADGTH